MTLGGFKSGFKIDCHMHVNGNTRNWGWRGNDKIIDAADRLGIDKLCCSIPITSGMPDPDQVRRCNDDVLEAMRRYPERILGYCFVNPGYQKESIDEMERCIVKHGMMGIKLYNQYKCSDPVVFPIVEKAIDLGIPILFDIAAPLSVHVDPGGGAVKVVQTRLTAAGERGGVGCQVSRGNAHRSPHRWWRRLGMDNKDASSELHSLFGHQRQRDR